MKEFFLRLILGVLTGGLLYTILSIECVQKNNDLTMIGFILYGIIWAIYGEYIVQKIKSFFTSKKKNVFVKPYEQSQSEE